MSRFSTIVAAVAAACPVPMQTTFLVGSQHLGKHQNWNRIVAFTRNGRTTQPAQNAGSVGRGDEWVWTRTVDAVFEIWASSYDAAESRLHALLVALDAVFGSSDDVLGSMQEQWYLESSNTSGCRVDLTMTLALRVLTSDALVVEDDQEPGAGFPLVTPTSIEIDAVHVGPTDETIATLTVPAP